MRMIKGFGTGGKRVEKQRITKLKQELQQVLLILKTRIPVSNSYTIVDAPYSMSS